MTDRLWTGGRAALDKGLFREILTELQEENLEEFQRRGYLGKLWLAWSLRRKARRLARERAPDSALY